MKPVSSLSLVAGSLIAAMILGGCSGDSEDVPPGGTAGTAGTAGSGTSGTAGSVAVGGMSGTSGGGQAGASGTAGTAGVAGQAGSATAGSAGSTTAGSGGTAGAGTAGAGTAGMGTAGTGTAGMGTAGTGTAGMGTAGTGTAGMGTAGTGTAGMGTAGTGTAGMGTAGTGTAGMGTAGTGTAGMGTSGTGTAGMGTAGMGMSGAGTAGMGMSGAGTAGMGTSGTGTAGMGMSGAGTAGMGMAGAGTAGMGMSGMGTAGMGMSGMGTAGMGMSGMGTAGMGMSGAGTAGSGTAGAAGGPPVGCGNGTLDPTEECDDMNTDPNDGCSSQCKFEPGTTCGDAIDVVANGTNANGVITLTGTTTGSMVFDLGDPSCSSGAGAAVPKALFKYVPTKNVKIAVETVDDGVTSMTDTVLWAYRDCAAKQPELACDDDDGAGLFSQFTLSNVIPAGTPTYIALSGWDGAEVGDYELQITEIEVLAAGSACDPASSTTECESGSTCSGSAGIETCTQPAVLSQGTSCDPGNTVAVCDTGLLCLGTSGSETCVPPTILPVGSNCDPASVAEVCDTGLLCSGTAGMEICKVFTSLLSESFDSDLGAFTVDDPNMDNVKWSFCNPNGSCSQTSNSGSMSAGGFALFKDTQSASSKLEWMTSPALNPSGLSQVFLSFYHAYDDWSSCSDSAVVQISTDGQMWTELVTYQGMDSTGLQTFDITSNVTGQAQFFVRFEYNDSAASNCWAEDWQIDDVQIYGVQLPRFIDVLAKERFVVVA
jgi:cysteine-rich repeat protein